MKMRPARLATDRLDVGQHKIRANLHTAWRGIRIPRQIRAEFSSYSGKRRSSRRLSFEDYLDLDNPVPDRHRGVLVLLTENKTEAENGKAKAI